MQLTVHQRYMIAAVVVASILLVHFLGAVLTPFVVSMVLAYLGDPLADWLESKGLSRSLSVTCVFFLIFSILAMGLLLVIPALAHQIKAVVQLLPVWAVWIESNLVPLISKYVSIDPALFDFSEMSKQLASQWKNAGGLLANLGVSISRSSMALLGFLANLTLVPVVTFYLLRDWDKMMGDLKMMLPRNVEPVVVTLMKECDEVLGAFLKGQLMVMMALGGIYSLGLMMIGLEFSILIGMLAGLASIIPYMGFVIGFAAAIVVALFQFDTYTGIAMVTAVFLVGQVLESWVLTPMLVGERIGLHPVAVIFALMAGGQLFGFVGMLIALPMGAIIMVLLRHLHRNYKSSDLYHAGLNKDRDG
ncbi:AI-2E family transporter [Endozoicomonas ascidiicola]|uniref:AI-2E family transporter n=1 Tax=Endozoicomonas ascidiicola TaxID=1698521 RepID=UPI0008347E54|nr:AI-2E family transporter [Endozoicomonas ascidiicola]